MSLQWSKVSIYLWNLITKISDEIDALTRFVYENKTDNIIQNTQDNIYQKQKYSLRNDIIYTYSEHFYTRFRFEGVIINYAGFQNSRIW